MDSMTLDTFIEKTADGKIFTVDFIKRTNGEPRTMNCRRNVQKGVKGVGLKFDPKEKDLLVVYDMQKINEGTGDKGAFRMINLSDMTALRMDGNSYSWNGVTRSFDRV